MASAKNDLDLSKRYRLREAWSLTWAANKHDPSPTVPTSWAGRESGYPLYWHFSLQDSRYLFHPDMIETNIAQKKSLKEDLCTVIEGTCEIDQGDHALTRRRSIIRGKMRGTTNVSDGLVKM